MKTLDSQIDGIQSARRATAGVATLLLCAALAIAGAVTPLHAANTVGLVAAGLGGTPEYAESFTASATTIAESLRSLDPADGTIELQADDADRESILASIESLGEQEADTFILVLIGHGTVDGRSWKFNVAGPDPSGDDLIGALATVKAARQIVVLGASASGVLLETLAQPGRVVVTATKSGGEINAVRFPGFLADALASEDADIDRNEVLTVAEAFRFADARTKEHYDVANLLASEHARINGDDASVLALARLGSLALAGDDPAVAALLDTRLSLEGDYRDLRARKPSMAIDDYYTELETLMLAIAGLQRAIDRTSGWSDDDASS